MPWRRDALCLTSCRCWVSSACEPVLLLGHARLGSAGLPLQRVGNASAAWCLSASTDCWAAVRSWPQPDDRVRSVACAGKRLDGLVPGGRDADSRRPEGRWEPDLRLQGRLLRRDVSPDLVGDLFQLPRRPSTSGPSTPGVSACQRGFAPGPIWCFEGGEIGTLRAASIVAEFGWLADFSASSADC